jgi:hypothetical protein
MALNLSPGAAAVPSQNNTGTTLCHSDAVEAVTPPLAPAGGSGQNRYDLVIVQPRSNDLDGGSNADFQLTSVTGALAGSPAIPPTPPGALALYWVYIPGGSAAIDPANITDVRPGNLSVPAPYVPPVLALQPMTTYWPAIRSQPGDWHGGGTAVFQQAVPAIAGGYEIKWQFQMFAHLVAGTWQFAQCSLDIDTARQGDNFFQLSTNVPWATLFMSGSLDIVDGRAVTVYGRYGSAPGYGGTGQVGYEPGGYANYMRLSVRPHLLKGQ